jgi:hypothetical protein
MAQSKIYLLADPAALAAKVKAAGGPQLDPSQPTGEASADGVTLGWEITDTRINITILSKPWFMPYGVLWGKIDAMLA